MSKLVEFPEEKYRNDAFYGFSVAPSFSIGTARAAAWLSQLAYESNWNKIKSILERWGLQLITPIDRPLESILPMVRTRGFTANGPEATFIVFSGTDPLVLEHWITDFSFLPSLEGIHHGFQRAAEVAWADVQRAADDAIASNHKLFLVGHSLGAAIAAISAVRLQHRSPLCGRCPPKGQVSTLVSFW